MLANYFNFFLSVIRSCFTSQIFIIPLGFITLCLLLNLFKRMSGGV